VTKIANQAVVAHTGPARVFDGEQLAFEAVMAGSILKGDVIIVRYEGPKGGPGTPELTALTGALFGAGFGDDVAIITDGRFGGGTQGIAIGHACPEAAAGGPIAAVRDGDIVCIDIPNGQLDVQVSDDELKDRLAAIRPPEPRYSSGVLAKYAQLVGSAATGARCVASCQRERFGDTG
jgi:dihydroxy-acid dehydratase